MKLQQKTRHNVVSSTTQRLIIEGHTLMWTFFYAVILLIDADIQFSLIVNLTVDKDLIIVLIVFQFTQDRRLL